MSFLFIDISIIFKESVGLIKSMIALAL